MRQLLSSGSEDIKQQIVPALAAVLPQAITPEVGVMRAATHDALQDALQQLLELNASANQCNMWRATHHGLPQLQLHIA